MIRKFVVSILIFLISCSSDPNSPIDINKLEYNSIEGSYYYKNLIGQISLYSGQVIELDKNKKIISEGSLYYGKKNGLFKSYDSTNSYNLLLEENYRDGKLDGISRRYNSNNSILSVENFRNGTLDGESSYYNTIGELIEKVNFTNGKRDGLTIVYNVIDPKTSLKSSFREDNYVNGILNGESIFYNSQNKKTSETFFKDGIEVGPYKNYFSNNGQLSFQSDINQNDKCEGTLITFYNNGNKKSEGLITESDCYRDFDSLGDNFGKNKEGFWTFWYENGKKHSEGSFTKDTTFIIKNLNVEVEKGMEILHEGGLETGLWTRWNENGTIKSETEYRLGMLSGKIKDYENGNLIREWRFGIFNIDGELKSKQHGPQKSYHQNGMLKNEFHFGSHFKEFGSNFQMYKNVKCPDKYITCQTWYESSYNNKGELQERYNYKNGERNGSYKKYWDDGSLFESGNYKNGKLHGEVKNYDSKNGIHWRTQEYKNGRKIYDSCKSCKS